MGIFAKKQIPVKSFSSESIALPLDAYVESGPGHYLVSIVYGEARRTVKWDASHSFSLDFPATLFLEKDDTAGIRVIRRVSEEKIEREETLASLSEPLIPGRAGAETEVGEFNGKILKLRIARVLRTRTAALPMITGSPNPYTSGEMIYVSCGLGGLLSQFNSVAQGGVFAGQVERYKLFKLRRTSKGAYASAQVSGVMMKLCGQPEVPLPQMGQVLLLEEDLRSLKLSYGNYWWRFNRKPTPVFSKQECLNEQYQETRFFKQTALGLLASVSIALMAVLFFPRTETAVEVAALPAHVSLKKPKIVAVKPQKKSTQKQIVKTKVTAESRTVSTAQVQVNDSKSFPPQTLSRAAQSLADLSGLVGTTGATKSIEPSRSIASQMKPAPGHVSLIPTKTNHPEVLKILSQHLAGIQSCYNELLSMNPALKGTVTIEWVISPDGTPIVSKLAKPDPKSEPLRGCVGNELRQIRFVPTKNGPLTVKFPFIFANGSL